MNAILGGWKLGGIFQARSGLPITVIDGRNRSLQGERGAERPNCVGDPHPADQSIDHWLDINAFEAAPLGTFGNCPVGVARAPGLRELRSDARQALRRRRHAVRRVPGRGVQRLEPPELRPAGARHLASPATFGVITNTISSPRVIELVLKFYF